MQSNYFRSVQSRALLITTNSMMFASNKYTAPKEDDAFTFKIPLKTDVSSNPADDREIDLREMDEQEVNSLHKSDPFMYYSIPGVLRASLTLKEVDYSNITSLSHADSPFSNPSQPQEVKNDASKVSRRSRISFECHPSELLEEMMNDLDEEFGGEDLGLDDILSKFCNRTNTTRQ